MIFGLPRRYDVAQNSLDCYLKSTNYTKIMVDLDTDARVNKSCWMHKSVSAWCRNVTQDDFGKNI